MDNAPVGMPLTEHVYSAPAGTLMLGCEATAVVSSEIHRSPVDRFCTTQPRRCEFAAIKVCCVPPSVIVPLRSVCVYCGENCCANATAGSRDNANIRPQR